MQRLLQHVVTLDTVSGEVLLSQSLETTNSVGTV